MNVRVYVLVQPSLTTAKTKTTAGPNLPYGNGVQESSATLRSRSPPRVPTQSCSGPTAHAYHVDTMKSRVMSSAFYWFIFGRLSGSRPPEASSMRP